MASDSTTEVPSNPLSDEGECFMEELENAIRCTPFIFKVPESVYCANPDAFLPCLIFLGLHTAKNKMEFYKHYMAIKVRGELHLPEFDQLCSQLGSLRLRILACYDTHLEIDGDNLARVMLVDALFLLQLLLNISAQMENSVSIELPLPNFDDQIHSFNIDNKMLLNDVVKLQNQIPLLIFQRILADLPLKAKWPVLVYHFSKSISLFAFDPYEEISDICAILDESHHLLHFMYLSILTSPGPKFRYMKFSGGAFLKWQFRRLEAVLDFIQNAMELRDLIEKLVEPITIRMMLKKQTTSSPVLIPSASHLHKLSVYFKSTVDGIRGTEFTKPKRHYSFLTRNSVSLIPSWNRSPPELTLPVLQINAFTETLFENLLAFEAMANINPPVYSLYIHLMKALIRNTKDVQILKENGIIESHLENDEQVVKLFQTLGSSISKLNTLTFKNFLPNTLIFYKKIKEFEEVYNRMIVEINQYYESCWRVQATRLRKMLVSYVWKMGAILLILFQIYKVAMELFSSVIEFFQPSDDHIPPT